MASPRCRVCGHPLPAVSNPPLCRHCAHDAVEAATDRAWSPQRAEAYLRLVADLLDTATIEGGRVLVDARPYHALVAMLDGTGGPDRAAAIRQGLSFRRATTTPSPEP